MKITFLQLVNHTDRTLNLLVPQFFLRGIILEIHLFHKGYWRDLQASRPYASI